MAGLPRIRDTTAGRTIPVRDIICRLGYARAGLLIIPLLGGIGAVAQVICGVVSTPHTVYNLARGRTWDKVDRCYRDSSNLVAEEARVRASTRIQRGCAHACSPCRR